MGQKREVEWVVMWLVAAYQAKKTCQEPDRFQELINEQIMRFNELQLHQETVS